MREIVPRNDNKEVNKDNLNNKETADAEDLIEVVFVDKDKDFVEEEDEDVDSAEDSTEDSEDIVEDIEDVEDTYHQLISDNHIIIKTCNMVLLGSG